MYVYLTGTQTDTRKDRHTSGGLLEDGSRVENRWQKADKCSVSLAYWWLWFRVHIDFLNILKTTRPIFKNLATFGVYTVGDLIVSFIVVSSDDSKQLSVIALAGHLRTSDR